MLKRLLQLTLILIILFLAKEASAGIIIRPVHHFGLVGYWDFEEREGTIANDHSGNSNHGTLMWMATSTPTGGWTDGRIGSGLEFDGNDDYVDLPAIIPDSPITALTFSMWVNPQYNPTTYSGNPGAEGGDSYGYAITCGASYWHFMIRVSSGSTEDTNYFRAKYATSNFNENNWYHLVGTYDGGPNELKFYSDGILRDANTGVPDSFTNPAGEAWIGMDTGVFGAPNEFNGLIDEVRIYNRALSAGEVERLYKMGQPKWAAGTDMTGLVGYWRFDEGTGAFVGDHSGQGNNGTWNGTGAHWTDGKYGTAGQFNGSDDYVNVTHNTILNPQTSDFTVGAWFKSGSTDNNRYIVDKYNNPEPSGPNGYLLNLNGPSSDGRITVYIGDGTNSIADGKGSGFNDNQWHYVTLVINYGSVAKIFVDAIQQGTDINISGIVGSINSAAPLRVGWLWASDYFDGLIDEVRIYNRALSASEVEALYKTGLAKLNTSQTDRLTDGLVGMWSFDGPDIYWPTNTANDRSGQGNHGAITNMNTSTAPTAGKVGQALDFDGGDDEINLGNNASVQGIDSDNEWSFSMWAYYSGSVPTGNEVIKKDDWHIYLKNGEYSFQRCSSGWPQSYCLDGAVPADEWHHVAITGSGNASTIKYYINGIDQTATPVSFTWDGIAGDLWIGGEGDSDNFPGIIDEVRIYNRALSADEIKRLYNMGR